MVYGVSDIPKADPLSRVNTFVHVNHTRENPRYGILLCINGTGIMNAWTRRNFAHGLDYDGINSLAASAPAGSDGVRVLPFGKTVILVGALLSFFQQAIGINVVLYYAPRIFENLGASSDASMVQTVVMGIVNIIFTLVAIFTVDKVGRKPLLIIGSIGMMIGMIALAAFSFFDFIGIGALVFIILYTASFMMSWGPICWVLISEIFPNTIRSQAVAIAVAVQWVSNFLVSATFPSLSAWSVGGTYLIYAAMSLLSALFVWRLVPETKGKSLEDMSALWKGRR